MKVRNGRTWLRVRRLCLERDGWRCTSCGRAGALEAHHELHVQHGGQDGLENLATLCRECHLRKHGRRRRTVGEGWKRLVATMEAT